MIEFFPAKPYLPFSAAVRVGDVIYCSGALPVRPDGTLPDGIAEQTRQALANVSAALSTAGSSLADVFKCTVMLADMADWPAFNEAYLEHFPAGRLPARSAFGVGGLGLGARLEIECLAAVRS